LPGPGRSHPPFLQIKFFSFSQTSEYNSLARKSSLGVQDPTLAQLSFKISLLHEGRDKSFPLQIYFMKDAFQWFRKLERKEKKKVTGIYFGSSLLHSNVHKALLKL
jgi:hypothetical protein